MSAIIEMIVQFHLKPGKADRLLELLAPIAKHATDSEPGCQLYSVFTQTKGKSGTIYITERYADQAALDAHLSTAEFKTLAAALEKEDLLTNSLDFDEVFVKSVHGHVF